MSYRVTSHSYSRFQVILSCQRRVLQGWRLASARMTLLMQPPGESWHLGQGFKRARLGFAEAVEILGEGRDEETCETSNS